MKITSLLFHADGIKADYFWLPAWKENISLGIRDLSLGVPGLWEGEKISLSLLKSTSRVLHVMDTKGHGWIRCMPTVCQLREERHLSQ